MSANLECRPRRSLYPLRRAGSLLRGSAYNLMQVFLTFAFLSKNEMNEEIWNKLCWKIPGGLLYYTKWNVPVDFVWTADLQWHYINWWKTRKQRIRDENVTTEGSSWWYSTIYVMLKNHSVLLTNWRSSDYQTCHKKQNQKRLAQKSGLLKKYPSLLITFNNSLDLQKWMNRSFRKWHWSKQAYHLHNFYQIPNLPFLRLV